jgi:GDP-L-fucose synthase
MKIALLGGDGFVGKNVASVLATNDISFINASRKTGLDLRDANQTVAWFSKNKPEIVVNCAAHVGSLNYVSRQAADIIVDNSRMVLAIYEAIAKVNPACVIINPIANCTYPAVDEKFEEDDIWKGPVHSSVYAYGGAKRFLLMLAKTFEMQFDIKSIQLLVPNMYGPFDSPDPDKAHALNALISRFVKAEKLGNKEITLWGTGVAIREWLYAEDFGKAVLHIIKDSSMLGLAEPLNIAQNFGLSIKELVSVIQKHFQNSFSIKWDVSMPDGAPKKVMDDTRFKKVFPEFQFTDFNKGIEETIRYYKSIYPY